MLGGSRTSGWFVVALDFCFRRHNAVPLHGQRVSPAPDASGNVERAASANRVHLAVGRGGTAPVQRG